MSDRLLVVACIPAYNEKRTIGRVVVRILKCVDGVVVFDDGSRDFIGEVANGRDATLDPCVWMGE